jgi:hypothetical protein
MRLSQVEELISRGGVLVVDGIRSSRYHVQAPEDPDDDPNGYFVGIALHARPIMVLIDDHNGGFGDDPDSVCCDPEWTGNGMKWSKGETIVRFTANGLEVTQDGQGQEAKG